MAEETGGLLSFLNDPTNVGLLSALGAYAAGAQRGTPINNIGRGLVGGIHGYAGAQGNLMDLAQKKAQLQWANDIGKSMGGQAPAQSMAALSASPQASNSIVDNPDTPTWAAPKAAAQQAQSAQQQPGGIPLPLLMRGAALGMKNIEPLFNMYKYANDGIERKPGTIYRNPITGAEEYVPEVKTGLNYDPRTGQTSVLPGFLAANNAIKGGEASATEAAKAKLDLIDGKVYTVGGRPVVMSRYDLLNGGLAGQSTPPQPASSGAKPATPIPANWGAINAQYSNGQAQRNSEQLSILQQELANEKNPANIAMLRREIARFGGDVSKSAPVQFDTAGEQAAQKAQAEANVDVSKQNALKVQETARGAEQRYGQMAAAIPEARKLLQKATGSGVGALYDTAAGFFGKTPPGALEARQLETISAWMTMNTPRMEGPQSDKDSALYRQMSAMVGDRTVPNDQRMKALDTLESLQEKYRHLNVPEEQKNPRISSNPASHARGALTPAEQAELAALRKRFGR